MASITEFDELMYSLYKALEYDTFDDLGDQDHIFVKSAIERNDRLKEKLDSLAKEKEAKGTLATDPLRNILSNEWKYIEAASSESDLKNK